MIRKSVSVLVASLAMLGVGAVQAQDKSRADVKAETKAAGVDGAATADKPTPGGKVAGGKTRAEVKSMRGKDGGAMSADAATPGGKVVGGKTRAQVKAERGNVDGSATAEKK